MGVKSALLSAALVASAVAQFATYSEQTSGSSLAVSIPEDTAITGSGPIYMQISAPKGLQWVAFAQGDMMADANMFVIYTSGSNNITVSPRQTTAHNPPTFNSAAKIAVLGGTGLNSDGSMLANIRCDNCLSWSTGSMKPTANQASWVMAYKSGSPLNGGQTATIQQHDEHVSFTLDLTKGIGGSSSNPFVAASSGGQSSGTATAGASATGSAISTPIASSYPGSSSSSSTTTSSSSSDNTDTLTSAHGILMSLLFLGFFPFFALTLYLPTTNRVRFIHAPLQILSVILLIAGMALGIVIGSRLQELDTYHQIIGFIIVFFMVVVQPTMGVMQHLHFHKTGSRSMWGPIHQGLGRVLIILGIINGGLGWHQSGTTSAYVPYAIVAVAVFVIYTVVSVWFTIKSKNRSMPIDKETKSPNGYEMQNTHRRLDSENVKQATVQAK